MNDLSKASTSVKLDNILPVTKVKPEKPSKDLNQSASKWEKVIDVVSGKVPVKKDPIDDATYGPSLPPKPSAPKLSNSKSKSTTSSKSTAKAKDVPLTVRGGRGRGVRGRGRGRGRGGEEAIIRGRGKARGIRGGRGYIPTRGRHVFGDKASRNRRSRSSSSSSSSRGRSRRSRRRSRSRDRYVC